MSRRVVVIPAFFALLLSSTAMPVSSSQTAAGNPQALMTQYCIGCHSQESRTAGLALDAMDLGKVAKDAVMWERVVRKVRTGMMPPAGIPRPPRAALDAFAADIEGRLDRAAAQNPNPGSPSLHRLNRAEYANAVRDLLAIEVDASALLPADDSDEGFDNLADALNVSPSLIQSYVLAAMKISRKVVGDRTLVPSPTSYPAPTGLVQDRQLEGLPIGTRGGMVITHTFPLDAEYQISAGGGGIGGGGRGGGGGTDITLDGVPLGGRGRVPVTAGPHVIAAATVEARRAGGVDDAYSDFRVNSSFGVGGGVQAITITGPYNATGVGNTPSRRRVFTCTPQSAAEEPACAQKIVSGLARRAFRRPWTDAELETLMTFYQQGRKEGDFETGIQQAIARILVSPKFLFRSEDEPANLKDGAVYRLNDVALASRLSFFLWSSIPDDELLNLAIAGKLKDPKTLDDQVRRMLDDPKSKALTENFAGQWLYLREVTSAAPDTKEFDANLRQALRRETEMLFESILRENRSVVTLLDSDYTFVNERLARHYGIPGIRGDYFRRIALEKDNPRRGILGQGSILTVTSIATRTSPVLRGKWILQNVLGTPAPVPPPGVEVNLDADPKAPKPTSLRERLELHRQSSVCASCHKIMDPLGFSLENFDMIGKWRDTDSGIKIDASGTIVDGTKLAGIAELRKALLTRSDSFVTSTTERLMTYALGRPVEYFDMPAVRTIVRDAAKNNSSLTSLIVGVVKSQPFQMKMKKPAGETAPKGAKAE